MGKFVLPFMEYVSIYIHYVFTVHSSVKNMNGSTRLERKWSDRENNCRLEKVSSVLKEWDGPALSWNGCWSFILT